LAKLVEEDLKDQGIKIDNAKIIEMQLE